MLDKKSKFQKRLEEAMENKDNLQSKKSKFTVRLEEAMKASNEAKKKAGQKAGFQGFTYDNEIARNVCGNYNTSNAIDKMGGYGSFNTNGGYGVCHCTNNSNTRCAPEHYGQTLTPKKPIGHLEAEEKFIHMELSEYGSMYIVRKDDKGEFYILFDLDVLLKPTHRVFNFLDDHKQFEVITKKAGTFVKSVRIKSFKIMLEDFLGYGEEAEQTKD